MCGLRLLYARARAPLPDSAGSSALARNKSRQVLAMPGHSVSDCWPQWVRVPAKGVFADLFK